MPAPLRFIQHPLLNSKAVCLLLTQALLCAHAQSPSESSDTTPHSPVWSAGLGWFRYSEPDMKLEGPQLTLRVEHELRQPRWPVWLEADIGMGQLRYSSDASGTLSQLPLLHGRASALWRIDGGTDATAASEGIWRAGAQIEGTWTDLRGTSSMGHSGYERFNRKLWAVVHHELPGSARQEGGVLLYGRQQSFLSQVPASPGLPDITNRQTRGFFLGYRHNLWRWSAQSERALRPWVRYTEVSRSDQVGAQGWYEPRNRTLLIGVEMPWP